MQFFYNYFHKINSTIFKGHTDNTIFQLIRYTFVGGIAFIVDFSTLFFLTQYSSVHYLLSAAIGFTLGLCINYFLSILWIFKNSTYKSRQLEFLLFTTIGIIGLGITELSIWSLTYLFEIHYLFSKLITTIVVYLWNFFARKYLLFNNKS